MKAISGWLLLAAAVDNPVHLPEIHRNRNEPSVLVTMLGQPDWLMSLRFTQTKLFSEKYNMLIQESKMKYVHTMI